MNHSYSLQLYSVRDFTEKDLADTMEKVAEIGYTGVEFAGFFGHSAEEVKAMLEHTGLVCTGTHSGWEDLTPTRIMDTIAYHKAIGNPHYIVPGADLGSLEKIDRFAKVMNFAKPILEAEGISLGYHNHSHEFVVMPWGSTIHSELERRIDMAFEIDTYWAWNAGLDPIAVLERLQHRLPVIHLKDGFAGGKGAALGEGKAPVKAVRDWAAAKGVTMVVESETLNPDGLSEVTRCFNYLRSID